MIFAQFYQKAVYPVGTNQIIEASGDRSVIVLDGRNSQATHKQLAKLECVKRGYLGYRLFSGETFTRSAPITEYINCK